MCSQGCGICACAHFAPLEERPSVLWQPLAGPEHQAVLSIISAAPGWLAQGMCILVYTVGSRLSCPAPHKGQSQACGV